jgi:hypothetical protein
LVHQEVDGVISCAQYIANCKRKLAFRSDRELGERFGCSTQAISIAKRGKMTDPLAIKIAEVLSIPPGEVLWVARTERERDPEVRKHLEAWGEAVGKVIAAMPVGVAHQQMRDGVAVSWRKRSVAHRPPSPAATAPKARPARAFFMPLFRPA